MVFWYIILNCPVTPNVLPQLVDHTWPMDLRLPACVLPMHCRATAAHAECFAHSVFRLCWGLWRQSDSLPWRHEGQVQSPTLQVLPHPSPAPAARLTFMLLLTHRQGHVQDAAKVKTTTLVFFCHVMRDVHYIHTDSVLFSFPLSMFSCDC